MQLDGKINGDAHWRVINDWKRNIFLDRKNT